MPAFLYAGRYWLMGEGKVLMGWESAASCLACPLCFSTLTSTGKSLICAHGHAFDIAADGHVNLLLGSRRSARLAGDSKDMVRARRAFLERGHYAALAAAINRIVADYLSSLTPGARRSWTMNVLDAGCGEGYYLSHLRSYLAEVLGSPMSYHGMDLSKDAARQAAKRGPGLHVAVADVNGRLPYVDACFQVLLDIFAPRNPPEFARVLVPGGLLLVVIPTPGHLRELRSALPLLNIEEDKRQKVIERLHGHFDLARATSLAYEIELEAQALGELIQMSPSARHLSPVALDQTRTWGSFRTHVGFELLGFRRN